MTGTASPARRSLAHARWEIRLLLRNGEQVLLTLIIPVGIMLGLTLTDLFAQSDGDDRAARALATVLAVSVISTAFTSLSIATAFERRSGALRFLGTTPLTRTELLTGKALATLVMTGLSAVVATATATAVGWRPGAGVAWVVPLLVLGTAVFAAWGMSLAGLLRAEAVLAVANGLFLFLLMFGGVVIPAASLPGPLAAVAPWLPSGALVDALTTVLVDGAMPSWSAIAILLAWGAAGTALAARTFRWS